MRRYGILLVAWLLLCVGCGYGEVSPTTYELAQSLYNISNRRLSEKLAVATEQIDAALAQEEISSQEAEWLRDIVARAEAQRWTAAMQSARAIMEDQVAY